VTTGEDELNLVGAAAQTIADIERLENDVMSTFDSEPDQQHLDDLATAEEAVIEEIKVDVSGLLAAYTTVLDDLKGQSAAQSMNFAKADQLASDLTALEASIRGQIPVPPVETPPPPPPPAALDLTVVSLPDVTDDGTTAYTATLTASGGVEPYTFAASGLPSGLAVSGDTISGVTSDPVGTVEVGLAVTDSATPTAGTVSITVPLNVVAPAAPPEAPAAPTEPAPETPAA
jgi:hypothetical protein